MAERQGLGRGYEDPGVDTRKVVIAGVVLLIACAVSLVLATLLFRALNAREAGGQQQPSTLAGRAGREEPPEPRLQTAPFDDAKAMRAEEENQLRSYGWVDRKAGVVRLPIERAIDLVAERGLPSWAGSAPTGTAAPSGSAPQSGDSPSSSDARGAHDTRRSGERQSPRPRRGPAGSGAGR